METDIPSEICLMKIDGKHMGLLGAELPLTVVVTPGSHIFEVTTFRMELHYTGPPPGLKTCRFSTCARLEPWSRGCAFETDVPAPGTNRRHITKAFMTEGGSFIPRFEPIEAGSSLPGGG